MERIRKKNEGVLVYDKFFITEKEHAVVEECTHAKRLNPIRATEDDINELTKIKKLSPEEARRHTHVIYNSERSNAPDNAAILEEVFSNCQE